MKTCGKTGTLNFEKHGNQSGRPENKSSCHAQRIGAETSREEYNAPTSHAHLEQVKRYAELMGNHKK